MDEKRRVAWESAIAKLDRGEEVPAKEHDALLREDMFKGPSGTDIPEEADLFLRYWLHGGGLSPTGYLSVVFPLGIVARESATVDRGFPWGIGIESMAVIAPMKHCKTMSRRANTIMTIIWR